MISSVEEEMVLFSAVEEMVLFSVAGLMKSFSLSRVPELVRHQNEGNPACVSHWETC